MSTAVMGVRAVAAVWGPVPSDRRKGASDEGERAGEKGTRPLELTGVPLVFPIRTMAGLGFARGSVSKLSGTRRVVTTQDAGVDENHVLAPVAIQVCNRHRDREA